MPITLLAAITGTSALHASANQTGPNVNYQNHNQTIKNLIPRHHRQTASLVWPRRKLIPEHRNRALRPVHHALRARTWVKTSNTPNVNPVHSVASQRSHSHRISQRYRSAGSIWRYRSHRHFTKFVNRRVRYKVNYSRNSRHLRHHPMRVGSIRRRIRHFTVRRPLRFHGYRHTHWFKDHLNRRQLKARSWISWHESNDHWNVLSYGGVCVGYFQLNPHYLGYRNGRVNLNRKHQVRVADRYVLGRYGSWVAAKYFWQAHHWY